MYQYCIINNSLWLLQGKTSEFSKIIVVIGKCY